VTDVRQRPFHLGGGGVVSWRENEEKQTDRFDAVVVAAPPHL